MYGRTNQSVTIFGRVGFEVMDKEGLIHRHFYRDYHLLTPIWLTIPLEQLAGVERLRQQIEARQIRKAA